MIKKNKFGFGLGILLVLTLFVSICAFEYGEEDDGNPFYEADALIKAPQISIRDLFILQPSIEPANPEIGMIYFDLNSKRLKLYDGEGWYGIALEKVSTVSKQQVKEKVEEKGEVKSCSESVECGDWGDCINNYQSMICITIDENCDKYTDTETRDCVSDFKLESSAKDSHDISGGESVSIDETEEEIITEDTTTDEETTIEEEETEKVEEVETEPEPAEEVPEELFDITFDLEENSLGKSDKLVVWVSLQNFGKRYVPARIIYTVTDETKKEVYKKFEEIRVYTDESIIKQFEDLVLEEGDYILSMRVEYAGIVEEFSDDFVVETGLLAGIKRFFSGWF